MSGVRYGIGCIPANSRDGLDVEVKGVCWGRHGCLSVRPLGRCLISSGTCTARHTERYRSRGECTETGPKLWSWKDSPLGTKVQDKQRSMSEMNDRQRGGPRTRQSPVRKEVEIKVVLHSKDESIFLRRERIKRKGKRKLGWRYIMRRAGSAARSLKLSICGGGESPPADKIDKTHVTGSFLQRDV